MRYNVLYEIVKIMTCIAEIFMIMDYYRAFHDFRDCFTRLYRRNIAAVIAIIASVGVNLANNNVINMLFMPLIWLGVLTVIFQGNIFTWIRDWLVSTFIIQSAEFIFVILLSVPMDMPTDEFFSNNFVMVSSMIGVKLVSFIMFLIVKQIPKSSASRVDSKIFLSYILVPVATLAIMLCIPYIRKESQGISASDVYLILLYVVIFVGDVMLFYFFEQYNSGKEKQMLQQIELTKYQEKQWHYNEIDRINKNHAVFIHNINHYLKQIGAYAREHNTTDITKALEDLQVEFLTNEQQVFCANGLLNSILTDFRERAIRKSIDVDIFVESGFKIEFMSGIDIAAVFGNLLDNTMEAAEKCEKGEIHLKLFMQNDGTFAVIRIQNNYVGQIHTDGKNIISSKKGKGTHGVGIKNVQEIIKKYRGFITNEYENQVYTTVILLPVE